MAKELSNVNILFLKSKVYKAARDGRADIILDLLSNLDSNDDETIIREVVNHHTQDGEQITTPLIIAAKNGRTEVVQVLLDIFHANMEETGVVTFKGEKFADNTALCCAVASCQLDIIELLLEHGANITHKAFNNVTPLTIACNLGIIDILQLLLKHVKDVILAQHYKNTGFCIACNRGNYWLMEYLIEVGADVNYQGDGGYTALHCAVYKDGTSLVEFLTKNGAVMKENNYGVTPLNTAAALGYEYVVNCLLESHKCTRNETIEVLELLGASFINHDNYDIAKCYDYLQEAMKERFKNTDEILEKSILPPVSVYNNKVECTTLEELQKIQFDPQAICMESLAARERILGLDPLVGSLLIKSAKWFYYQETHSRCIELLLHTLKHMQNIEMAFSLDGFVETYAKMQQLGQTINFETLVEVFQYAVFEIRLEKKQLSTDCMRQGLVSPQLHLQRNIEICICIITIMQREVNTKAQKDVMYRVIQQFIQLNPVLENGFTILHMCCDGVTLKRCSEKAGHHTRNHSFPSAILCKTLLNCEAKINALDNNKNTPLHLLAKAANDNYRVGTFGLKDNRPLQETLILLLDNGAHVDSSDSAGKTALDVATTEEAKCVIWKFMELRLDCLAARAIKVHGVIYQGLIPPSIQNFVELH